MFWALHWLLGYPDHGIDDADITMVYAHNIANGHGYVYTPGGERVEGSTSLAWTLVCAALQLLSTSSLPIFAVCIALTIVSVGAALEVTRRCGGGPVAFGFSLLFLVGTPGMYGWSTT